MGGAESTLAQIEGFQIARVTPQSPANIGGLIPFFDIITAVDGLVLERDRNEFFRDYIKKSNGKPVALTVFNLKIRAYRELTITPTDTWGGTGLLGCTINWENAERCLENTWHIVDVAPNSPASNNHDIMAQRDFLIGMQPPEETTITMFRDTSDFHNRIEDWRARRTTNASTPSSLLLLIYDSVENAVKEVLVDMGRQIHLGIDVANGYLHIVPAAPGTTKLPLLKKFYVASNAGGVPVAAAAESAAPPAFPAPPAPEPQQTQINISQQPPQPDYLQHQTAPAPAPAADPAQQQQVAPAPSFPAPPAPGAAPAAAPVAPVPAAPAPGGVPPLPAMPQMPLPTMPPIQMPAFPNAAPPQPAQ